MASLKTRTVFAMVRGPWTARTRSIAFFASWSSASEFERYCFASGRPAKKGGATVGRRCAGEAALRAVEPARVRPAARGADAAARDAPRAPSIVACARAVEGALQSTEHEIRMAQRLARAGRGRAAGLSTGERLLF